MTGMPLLLRIIALLVLAILLAAGGYYLLIGRENIHTVLGGEIYRSAQLDDQRLAKLIENRGIRSIVNLRGAEPGKPWYDEERALARRLGIALHDVRFSASGLPPYRRLKKLVRILGEAERPLLLHCRGGADRTGMASTVALLRETAMQIDEVKKQVSPGYLNFRSDSIGRLLINRYADWLKTTGRRHEPSLFDDWLEREYTDDNGNLLYYIDQINRTAWKSGTRYEDGYKYLIPVASEPALEVSGWAIDVKNAGLVKRVDIVLGDRPLGTVDYGYDYVGVARYFRNDNYLRSGWMIRASLAGWPDGCHDLALAITRLDSSQWQSPPQARVCLQH